MPHTAHMGVRDAIMRNLWVYVYTAIFAVLWIGLFFWGESFLMLPQWARLTLIGLATAGMFGTILWGQLRRDE